MWGRSRGLPSREVRQAIRTLTRQPSAKRARAEVVAALDAAGPKAPVLRREASVARFGAAERLPIIALPKARRSNPCFYR